MNATPSIAGCLIRQCFPAPKPAPAPAPQPVAMEPQPSERMIRLAIQNLSIWARYQPMSGTVVWLPLLILFAFFGGRS